MYTSPSSIKASLSGILMVMVFSSLSYSTSYSTLFFASIVRVPVFQPVPTYSMAESGKPSISTSSPFSLLSILYCRAWSSSITALTVFSSNCENLMDLTPSLPMATELSFNSPSLVLNMSTTILSGFCRVMVSKSSLEVASTTSFLRSLSSSSKYIPFTVFTVLISICFLFSS